MSRVLMIECAEPGLLTVNGQFCGPLEEGGQAFPMGRFTQAYMQFLPYNPNARPLALAVEFEDGRLARLHPQDCGFALVWPNGIVQLELRPQGSDAQAAQQTQAIVPNTLLRYLSLQLAGDLSAKQYLMRAQDGVPLSGYEAAVPLRFAPDDVSGRFDERAGLVRRIAPNAAAVDMALAATVPAGQGKRMIERIEIIRT